MALSFTSKIGFANRLFRMFGGLQMRVVDMTVGVTGDYSSGFDLAGSETAMGFRSIVAVLSASIRQSNGTHRVGQVYNFDHNTGKLRFVLQNAGAGVLAEITPASHLASGDVVRMVVVGF